MTSFLKDGRSRPVALWLFATAFLVFAMVVVGGATRLTGSGLSITEWKPVSGALPPLSEQAWRDYFHLYQQTPQYRLVNEGMTLGQFKFIFWWEWGHRLLGRLVGAVFGVGFIVFLVRDRMPRRLLWRCLALFGLGGLQGLVGWWMVESGLEARVSVAPERLATHLGLALILFCALIWTGLEALAGQSRPGEQRRDRWDVATATLAGLVFLQCLLGALVAGNQAGLIENDWPFMGGRLFPADYAHGSVWGTLAHGAAAVQFNHRILAYGVFAYAVTLAARAWRSNRVSPAIRGLAVLVGALVTAQASLGIATLIAGVPLALGIAHQAGAAIVLASAIGLAWRARRA
ncbi:MAG TPA: COX15/CtaA family protein [Caulobacteraceae bacterium]|nr:COX15/CtaA family protein [Caulobacteraceae bacterium]